MAAISWASGISGTWTTGADWSTGAAPTTSSDVTIAVAPATGSTAYTVTLATAASVDSVTLDQAAATLDIGYGGTLTVAKTFALTAGTLELDGGSLSGGTYSSTTGTVLLGPDYDPAGTITAVTWDGALNLAATSGYYGYASLGQTTFAGTGGAGSGTLSLGADVDVNYSGTSLNTVGIVLGSGSELYSYSGSLTLGSKSSVSATSGTSYIEVYGAGGANTGTLTNDGSISAAGSVSSVTGSIISYTDLTLQNEVFSNAGTISAGQAGEILIEAAASGTNTGLITIGAGGTVDVYSEYSTASTFTNGGTIAASGELEVSGTFDNTKLVSFSGTASSLSIGYSSNFANTGTISVSNGATINLGNGGTFTNTGTLLVSDATLILGGAQTAASLAAVKVTNGGTLALDGTLTNTGTLALGSGTSIPSLALYGGGEIIGGTIKDSGGGLSGQGGTLSGVTYDGTLEVANGGFNGTQFVNSLIVTGGITLAGAAGSGAGSIAITGAGSELEFAGSQTLNNASISIGSVSGTNGGEYDLITAGTYNEAAATTLTLGPKLAITQTGNYVEIETSYAADSVINQGTITAGYSDGQFAANGLTNAGTILISNADTFSGLARNTGTVTDTGGQLSLNGTMTNAGLISVSGTASSLGNPGYYYSYNLANSGTISLSGGASATLGGSGDSFSNTGTILVSASTLTLGGTFTTASLGTVKVTSGGTLALDGTLTNTGTLSLGSGSTIPTLALGYGGEISGGTIKDSGGGLVAQNGTLAGVSYDGTLDVASNFTSVVVTGGITLAGSAGTGAGSIAITGQDSDLVFAGSQTLNNASISIGSVSSNGGGYYDFITAGTGSETAGTTLTLGPALSITQVGNFVEVDAATTQDAVVNQGTITAGYYDGQFDADGLTNAGTILISKSDFFSGLAANSGTLSDTGGGLYFSGSVTNSGLISISGTASYLSNTGSYALANSGTISISSGAYVTLGGGNSSFTNTGTLLISAATASIGGTFTAASLGTVKISTGGTLGIAGTLTNSGTLVVGTGTSLPFLVLEQDGTIAGGAISDAGGGIVGSGGTLSGVTYRGELALATAFSSLTVTGGITVAPATGTGDGTIAVTGDQSGIDFLGSQSIANAVIDLGDPIATGFSNGIQLSDSGTIATTLTLSASTTLDHTGSAYIYGTTAYNPATDSDTPTGDTLINDGTFSLGLQQGYLSANDLNLDNAGLIAISNGDLLSVGAGTLANSGTLTLNDGFVEFSTYNGVTNGFVNTGLVTIGAGSDLTLDSNDVAWSNTGTIDVNGGTLTLGGTFTTAQLGNIVVSNGGSVVLASDAYLNNTGGTVAVGLGTALGTITLDGTIHGGVIADAGGGIDSGFYDDQTGTFINGTLDGVTYRGALSVAAYDTENITSGITLTGTSGSGTGSILLNQNGSALDFASTETLASTAISIGGTFDVATISAASPQGGTTLTLASTVNVTQTGAEAQIGVDGGTIDNAGHIIAAFAGGTLTLGGDIVNTGTIAVSNGETLALATTGITNTGVISVTNGVLSIGSGTTAQLEAVKTSNTTVAVTGELTATGTTLSVGNGTTLPVLELQGQIYGGTIHDPNGAVEFVGVASLENVTYEGTVQVNRPLSALAVEGTLSLTSISGTGAGSLSLTGAGSVLAWAGTGSLNNATVSIGSNGLTYEGHAVMAPAITALGTYSNYGILGAVPVSLGSSLTVVQSGTYADLGGQYDYYGGNTFEENYFDPTQGVVNSAATIKAGVSGGKFAVQGESFTSTGTIGIIGGDTFSAASAIFNNDGLISIGTLSTLALDLYNYFDDASLSAESFANFGSITLAGGTLTELTDSGTFPEIAMLNGAGASISGFGTISAAIINNGTITASSGTLTISQAVSGSGTLVVAAGERLNLASVASGEVASFASGTASVLGLSPASFLGKIGGFASGDTIDLANTVAKAASFVGSSLVVTLSTGSTIALATTSALTGSLTVVAGTSGDTLIEFGSAAGTGGRHYIPITPAALGVEERGVMTMDVSMPGIGEHYWLVVGH